MKKLILLSILSIGLFSCKKDYECTCTATLDGQMVGSTIRTYENISKEDAEDECYRWNGTTEYPFGTADQSCVLKEL